MIARRHFRGQLFEASIQQRHWLGDEVSALPVCELVVVDEDEQLEEDREGNGFRSGVHHDAGDLGPPARTSVMARFQARSPSRPCPFVSIATPCSSAMVTSALSI